MASLDEKRKKDEEQCLLSDSLEPEYHDEQSLQGKMRLRVIRRLALLLTLVLLAAGYFLIGCLEDSYEAAMKDEDSTAFLASNASPGHANRATHPCDTVDGGYRCFSELSHRWGQYSPFYSLAREGLLNEVPQECKLTFVQVLSRHGARYPTASKGKKYTSLIQAIQANATAYHGQTGFLRSYNYTLGSDDLTSFGQDEMVNSGIKFYQRYASLTRNHVPFIRSSDSSRVVASGELFSRGFEDSKLQDSAADHDQAAAAISVLISEEPGANNTLNHNTCAAFEANKRGDQASSQYAALIAPPIAKRLQHSLPGVRLSDDDVISLMDMCPYDTIASTKDASHLSPFCTLFTETEWSQYNYLQSLGKYYGYGAGNPLGPTQGVGFINELIARMTHSPVKDHTTINRTLDAPGADTFPVDRALYADFTHDNGMIPIFFAMGLYNGSVPLPLDRIVSAAEADGYSASWAVPFAARAYVEMMLCGRETEPLVRVLVNDRVAPLKGCQVDRFGRCRRDDFVNALSFARDGGEWSSCGVISN
ncbi:3-phytase A [Penicillium ucsense]|uniref:Phytase A n=1 Tax=Penicillium ucsense TaxID=2839758 RepID=A0A8J8W3T8_9EURO|nr:3-phytase A [Penicillium ucsense]KAF7735766.1 3-phytase A [Penicillium ucsense]